MKNEVEKLKIGDKLKIHVRTLSNLSITVLSIDEDREIATCDNGDLVITTGCPFDRTHNGKPVYADFDSFSRFYIKTN